jgi:hypothetical protein
LHWSIGLICTSAFFDKMHFFEIAAALAALSGSTEAMGLTVFSRDLTLAQKMGINSGELLKRHKSAHEIAMERSYNTLHAQYVSVWVWLMLYLPILTRSDSNRP